MVQSREMIRVGTDENSPSARSEQMEIITCDWRVWLTVSVTDVLDHVPTGSQMEFDKKKKKKKQSALRIIKMLPIVSWSSRSIVFGSA